MCDIWQLQNISEISAEDFLRLPKSLKDINISGGEPFLRQDISGVIKNIKQACPHAKLVISSNGLATEIVKNKMGEILKIDKNVGVAISIDGVGEVHDKIRGFEGACNKALNTLEVLKTLGVRHIKIAFTITNDNLEEMKKVYDLSRKLDVEFTLAAMQGSDIYFGGKNTNILKYKSDELKREFAYIIKNELKGWPSKKWVRAYFADGLYNFITHQGRALPIEAGHLHFFLDPQGNVYPSVVDSQSMGNITAVEKFEQIWCSEKNNKLKQDLKNGLAKPAWMICTARTAIKKHPFKVGWWIVRNKFFYDYFKY